MRKLFILILVLLVVSCAAKQPVQQARKAQKQQVALKPYNVIIEKLDEADKQYEKLAIKYQEQEIKNVDIEIRLNNQQRQIDSLKILHIAISDKSFKDDVLSVVDYNKPNTFPEYLNPFKDENFGNTVTRVSDDNAFNGNTIAVRHAYSKRQVWNADQSLIALAGNSPRILNGETGELIGTASGFGNMGWSNTNRLMSFFTSASNNVFQKRMLNESNYTISTVFTKTFSNYNVMSHWGNECNVSADDKYVALYGTRPGSSMCWVVVYDIANDKIVSEKSLNTSLSNVNWVSISQGGGFVLVQYNTRGSGVTQGTKSYDKNMNLVKHLTNSNPHGDMGFDVDGNEVWVSNDANQIRSRRLDGVGSEIQYAYVSGGHVSCRNINRPGWALVNDHGASSTNTYASYREVFYVKLDEKKTGETVVNRISKHYSNISRGYYHQPQAVASPNGDMVLFSSNMENSNAESKTYTNVFVIKK